MELTLPSGFCYTKRSSTSLETLAGKLGIWALSTSAQKFSTGQNHTSALALAKNTYLIILLQVKTCAKVRLERSIVRVDYN